MESGIKKKKLRRKARAGYRAQKQKNKEALVLALQENRNHQEIIEFIKKEAQRVDHQNENISLNNSVENNLQSKEKSQLSANFMLSSPLEQQKLPQNSEKKVDLLQPLKENSFLISQNQHCLPMQFKNTEAENLEHSNETVSSLRDSIKGKLQVEENSQLSTYFMKPSSLEQQKSPKKNSEKKVNLLQPLEKNLILLSQNEHCLSVQAQNGEAKKVDYPYKAVYDSIKDNLQSQDNCQSSADFMQSSSLDQQKLLQDNEDKIKSQENNVSSLCQNRIEKIIKIEEEKEKELSPTFANIELLLLKQEKLFIQHKNRIEKLELQNQMLTSLKKYVRLCNKHEEEVFKLERKLIEYELQIAQKKEKLK